MEAYIRIAEHQKNIAILPKKRPKTLTSKGFYFVANKIYISQYAEIFSYSRSLKSTNVAIIYITQK